MADSDSRSGRVYFSPDLLAWTAQLHAPHDASLARAFAAPKAHGMPAIQLGESESKLTTLLLTLAQAKKVVEVGTLAGYSALRLVRALPADGKLWTIEFDPRHAEVARGVIAEAGESARVEVLTGAGADVLPQLDKHGPFDAVFIDADKESYDVYGRWAAKHLRQGGLLLGDNAFLFGELLDDTPRSQVMRRFHEEAAQHFDTVCIPTPDGVALGREAMKWSASRFPLPLGRGAAGLALLVLCGCGAGLDGSLTAVLDVQYDSVELRQTADELSVAFVRKNGDTALQVTAALEGVTLAPGEALNLAEKLSATRQRGLLSRNVQGDTTTRFPELERGTLTLSQVPAEGALVSGRFSATLVQGSTEPYGRTVSGAFEAQVLQLP